MKTEEESIEARRSSKHAERKYINGKKAWKQNVKEMKETL